MNTLQKAYFDDGEDKFIEPTAKSIMKKTDEIFDKIGKDIKDVIAATFSEKEKVFEAMLTQADMGKNEKDKLVKERKAAVAELDQIIEKSKALQADY